MAPLEVNWEATFWTALGHVAVKKSVCRFVPASGPEAPPPSSGLPVSGHFPMILRMSG